MVCNCNSDCDSKECGDKTIIELDRSVTIDKIKIGRGADRNGEEYVEIRVYAGTGIYTHRIYAKHHERAWPDLVRGREALWGAIQ